MKADGSTSYDENLTLDYNDLGYGVVAGTEGSFKEGISGVKHPEWIGYESTTVSLASDVLNRLNTQNGIQPTDPAIIAAREPFRVGRFLVKWTKAPPFFPEIAVRYLRYIFEDMVREVGGIPENSLDTFAVTNGSVRQDTMYPGIYKEGGGRLNLQVYETQGSVVRKFLDYWISGISDRKTGICHMYGANIRAILPNMAGSFLYVLLGPMARPEDIEFSCMLHECFPSAEKVSHNSSGSIGDAGSGQSLDVEFNGIYDRGPEIDIYARKVVEGYNLYGQTFLNQLLPSYMYDESMYTSTTWTDNNSINIDDRLTAIKNNNNAQKIYSEKHIETRDIYLRSAGDERIPPFTYKTAGTNLGDMGIVTNGVTDTIDIIKDGTTT
jgi:hypothetical protein